MCRLRAVARQTLRYRSRRHEDEALRTRIREIAEHKRRYGCPRIYVRLRREGWHVNHKKVERIYYRDEGLSLRRRRRKKLAAVPRVALPRPTQPGRWYALDFVHDRLVTGRRYKYLTMTDPCSKEVPVIEVDVSIGGERVCRILDRLFLTRPLPETLILWITAPNSPGRRWMRGRLSTASLRISSSRGSRCRTPLSRASTASSEMSV
ncbi:hypothetical protein COMA2_160049 [Candidatus Nitrospira nitrificans]|uniref:HTH-like domain-containing protein n=1 Tax=Candidatus Nitrospira nitrificans TaxID=1742973 RepID=A0A0S4LED1_9BACT|nr:hypothetical protein COMA2_160049 [Candidatus Nitrospira nitrificans]